MNDWMTEVTCTENLHSYSKGKDMTSYLLLMFSLIEKISKIFKLSTDSITLTYPNEFILSLPGEQSILEALDCKLMNGEVLYHWHLQTTHGRFGFASVTIAYGANVTTGTTADFSAARENIFAESEEKWICFQICLWGSIVRLMNGTDISTKKKKMIEWMSFSKARTTSISLMLQPELRVSTLIFLLTWPQHWSWHFLLNRNHYSNVVPL